MTKINTKQSHAQELQANRAAIETFLKECVGLGTEGGPKLVQLVSIAPDATETGEAPLAQTFDNVTNAATWAAKQNAKHSVYFQPGEPGKKLSKKLSKRDVRSLPMLFADLDPLEGLPQGPASLAKWHGEVVPEIEAILDKHGIAADIVNTGGGLALFATLEDPFEIKTDGNEQYIEDLNARFHALFAGICKVDGTHDCAHLMRLPGTVNYPNKKKRAAGREAALAKWIVDDPNRNTLNIFDALPAVQSPARGNSTGVNYSTVNYSEDYKPWTLNDALELTSLQNWRGNGGKDTSGSAACYSLVQTAIDALLALEKRTLTDLDGTNARKNTFDLCDEFIERFPEWCQAVLAHLEDNPRRYNGKLSYDIERAFSGSEQDRAPEQVKRERAIKTMTAMLHGDAAMSEEKAAPTNKRKAAKQKALDSPNWVTDTHAAVKAALLQLALSEVEHNDPMEFRKLMEQIASKASQHGVDLHAKVMPGSRTTLLAAAYKAEKAAIKEEGGNERSHSGNAFPDIDERDGLPRKDSLPNVIAWLEDHKHDIWFDEFADEVRHGKKKMNDSRMLGLREEMHKDQFFAGTQLVKDGIHALAQKNCVHPVREYFDTVCNKWDGTKRLDTWLISYCGAPNNTHWRVAGRLLMIAIVMRIRHPGAKWDNILALLGPEGFGKSKLCRALAIQDDWHLPGYQLSWSQKETIENTAGIVIAEYEEMAGHSHKEQATLKAAASRAKDTARKAYGHFAETKKRTFVTIANANELEVLISKHGNRRFWPLHITKPIDVRGLEDVLDQLYGEAVHAQEAYLEKHGTDVELPEDHWSYFGGLQEQHRVRSPVEDRVNNLMDGFNDGHLLACDLYTALEISFKDRYQASEAEHAMKLCGWRKDRLRMGKDRDPQRYFIKGKSPETLRIIYERNTVTGRFYLQYAHDGAHDRAGNVVHLSIQKRQNG